MDTERVQNFLEKFKNVAEDSEQFLRTPNVHLCEKLKYLLKDISDSTQEGFINARRSAPQLMIENFDSEQIWQQIQLQNNEKLEKSVISISTLLAQQEALLFVECKHLYSKTEDDSEVVDKAGESCDEELNSEGESSNVESDVGEADENEDQKIDYKATNKTSAVDDKFFKLSEMERFLETQESGDRQKITTNDSQSDSEESINLFEEEVGDDADAESDRLKNPRFKDFFGAAESDARKPKTNKFLDNYDENDEKSRFELRQERLQKKISAIEEKAVNEKPWQLKGEITGDARPQNSLLEEVVDFNLTSRPAPVITQETSLFLEDVIRERIKSKVFDSVVRKQKLEVPLEYKKKLMLNQEKGKESLAQIYEKEYLKQKEALDPAAADKEEEESELQKEIKTLMHSLFTKLDALSNFHFTPKPVLPEVKIVTNLPAVSMEEVAPVAASESAVLAPEEVKSGAKGDLIGKLERTDTDKKRERRKKKVKQRMRGKRQRNKTGVETAKPSLQKVIKGKNVNQMAESVDTKSLKSSAAFFARVQDEVKNQINLSSPQKRKQNIRNKVQAKKVKL